MPADAKLTFPGLAFKYAMNFATLSAGTDGCTTRTFDNNIVPPTGTLSRTKSNGSFSYKLAFIALFGAT